MKEMAARPEGAEEMPQSTRLDDVRIREVRPLISPALLQWELPADDGVQAFIERLYKLPPPVVARAKELVFTARFVEDNPGRWFYHCHVFQHLHQGMNGWYLVS